MNSYLLHRRSAPLLLALVLLLSACAERDPQKLLESARLHLAQNNHPAAIIQLKNALQESPELAEARFLLGQTLLHSGDAVGAQTELQKARDLGYAPDQVTPLLVRSRIAQGQFRQVTQEFAQVELTAPQARAELHTLLAVAWRQQGNQAAFDASLQQALKLQPEYAPALVEQARLQAAQRDFSAALAQLERVLKTEPGNADALKLKGDIWLFGNDDPAQALAAYRAAVQARPQLQEARVAVIRVLLSQGALEEAAREIDALATLAPGGPHTLYVQTQLAFQKEDFKVARERAQQLLKLLPQSPIALEIAGVVEFELNALTQAQDLLARAVQADPQRMLARRVLVQLHLRNGQVERALAALPSDLASNDSDPSLLALAGQAYLVKGDLEQAQRFFARAARLDPNDPGKRTSLAVSQLLLGQTDLALDALQAIAATDPGVVADLALINAHLRQGQAEPALQAIAALEKKRAGDPMPHLLRGRVLLLRNDSAGARLAFARAQTMAPDYFAATAALAALDLAENQPAAAQQRFEAVLARQPDHVQALVALAQLRAAAGGKQDDVAALLRRAVLADPVDKTPRLALIEHYLRHDDPKEALLQAQTAVTAQSDVPELLDALGRAQMANRQHNQALLTFGKLALALPQSPLPHLRLASVHLQNKNEVSAEQSFRNALEITPDLLPAQRSLVELALRRQQPEQALTISRTVQAQRPKEAAGFILEGDIHVAANNWPQAVSAYRAGVAVAPGPELAVKLHTALTRAQQTAQAQRWAADWIRGHPKDPVFLLYLGDRAIAANQLPEAVRHYERVLELQPRNALALNNLAWVAGQIGRADALSLAERANAVLPNQPAFMDTLAVLLSQNKQHARALALQKQVLEMQPGVPVYKLHLAQIHLAAGDQAAARALLDELSALGQRFPNQAEVLRLQQQLR